MGTTNSQVDRLSYTIQVLCALTFLGTSTTSELFTTAKDSKDIMYPDLATTMMDVQIAMADNDV